MTNFVRHIYQATLSPEGFDRLVPDLEAEIVRVVSAVEGRDDVLTRLLSAEEAAATVAAFADLTPHAEAAAAIQARLGHLPHDTSGLEALLSLIPNPAVVLDRDGRILGANESAHAMMQPLGFQTVFPDPVAQRTVRRALHEGAGPNARGAIPINITGEGDTARWVVLRPLRLPDSLAAMGERLFLATFAAPNFGAATRHVLTDAYGLTPAECEVAIALAQGLSPEAVAAARGASLETVRGQIKVVKGKMGAGSIPDLVRIVCGFAVGALDGARAGVASGSAGGETGVVSGARPGFVRLPCGRRKDYLSQGDPEGAPVLLFHNMPYGAELPRAAQEAARVRGLHFVASLRPGHGHSGAVAAQGPALLDQVAGDTAALMDRLGLDRARLIGHGAGSSFALHFAYMHPNRASGLVMVSRAPAWHSECFGEISAEHRAFALSMRYTPRVAMLMIWAIATYINKLGAAAYLRKACNGSVPDLRAIEDAEIVALIAEGIRHGFRNGVEPYCRDFAAMEVDMTTAAGGLSVPIEIVHGEADRIVKPEFSRRFVSAVPSARLNLVPDAGNYLFYSHWSEVLAAVERLAA